MDSKQSIYWHQGLFLQPQHFQQLEIHQQFCRLPLFRMANPYPWGVAELDIAEQALSNRVFEIRNLKLLLPDRTYLEFPGNAINTPRSFDEVWADVDAPLNVYVGIRRFSPALPNVTVVDLPSEFDAVRTRFVSLSNADEARDLYSEGTNAPLPTLVCVTKIFFESELPKLDDYDVFFIARLERENEHIRVVQEEMPATYTMASSNFLKTLVRDIRDDMLGRVKQLEEYKKPSIGSTDEFDANFMTMMQAVQVLNRQVPTLTHLIEAESVHPWDVYGALRACIGELSTFSPRLDLYGRLAGQDETGGLPSYDHASPGPCFLTAKRLMGELLAELAVGPELRVVLAPMDGMFCGVIPQDYFANRNRFFLVLQSSGMGDLDVDQFLGTSRLASTSMLPSLIDHALPGLGLIELPGVPQGLPRRSDSRYFRIEQISQEWEQVAVNGEIAMYWPDAPEDLKVLVVVTKG